MIRKTFLITATVFWLSVGAAQAQSKPTILVKRSDLDLSKPADAQRLYDRIYEAASRVCGGGALVTFFPFPSPEFVACREAVLDAGLSQSHAPLVIALREAHANHLGK